MNKLNWIGGASGFVFRFLSYIFLRWIPGRHLPYILPCLFATNILSILSTTTSSPPPATATSTPLPPSPPPKQIKLPADSSLQPAPTPSYAAVASSGTENEKDSDTEAAVKAATINGALVPKDGTVLTKRNKKKKNNNVVRESQAPSSEVATLDKPDARTGAWSLMSLLIGSPTKSKVLNTFSVLTNLAIFAATCDLLWRPIVGMNELDLAFARVGMVDHQSVKILARIPPVEALASPVNTTSEGLWQAEQTPEAGAKVAYRPTKPIGRWIMGPTIQVSNNTDWTGIVRIDGLWASTEYEYRLLVPTLSNAHHPSFPAIQTFTTFPDPALSSPASPGAGTHFTFAASSWFVRDFTLPVNICVKPGFPYTGPQNMREVKGAKYLLDDVVENGIKFLVFLGDFIYSDAPYYPGPAKENYWKRYRQVMAAPFMNALLTKIPTVSIFDDHELFNDYSASVAEKHPDFYGPATTAFKHYLGGVNPDPAEPGAHYYDFRHGDSAFFVWDLRSYRSANGMEDSEGKTMLGEKQKEVFFDWLAKVRLLPSDAGGRGETHAEYLKVNQTVTWKFVVSSVPLMTLWYLPDGNSKYSTFEVDTRVANEPVVRVRVVIDGEEAWTVEIRGAALEVPPPPKGIGSLGKSLMELLGFKKRSWF
ncbi:alkaline phosphatase D, partial [Phenoliferia sp. Uapishka_3]